MNFTQTSISLLQLPLSQAGVNVLYGSLYRSAVGRVIEIVSTSVVGRVAPNEREMLYQCVQKANTVQQHAACVSPYLLTNQSSKERSDYFPSVALRIRRQAVEPVSLIETFLRWFTKLIKQMKHELLGVSPSLRLSKPVDMDKFLAPNNHNLARHPVFENQPTTGDGTTASASLERSFLSDVAAPHWLKDLSEDINHVLKSFDEENDTQISLKILSPRILPLYPEENVVNILSPDVLDLFEDGQNNVLSFKKFLNPLSQNESDAVVNLLREFVQFTKVLVETRSAKGMRDFCTIPFVGIDPLRREEADEYLGQQMRLFGELNRAYSADQMKELEEKGYTFLTEEQLRMLYKNLSLPFDSQKYSLMNDTERTAAVEEYVIALANDILSSENHPRASVKGNHDKIASSSIALSPLVISPLSFSPSIIGPIAVSPAVFNPVLVLPNKIGKPAPNILSAVIVHSNALEPSIARPQIINPHIVSPYTFSPFILSPVVISPSILSTRFLSPMILSPRVVSPIIISPYSLYANIVSPRILSPRIASNCTFCVSVVAPSILY